MKTRHIAIMLVVLVAILMLTMGILLSKHSEKMQGLSGQIVLSNPETSKNNGNGLMAYDLFTEREQVIGNNKYRDVIAINDKNYIATNPRNEIINVNFDGLSSIITKSPVGTIDFAETPGKRKISFMVNYKLQVFDTSNQKITTLSLPNIDSTSKLAGYSWSNDGESILYSNSDTIYSYEIRTKQLVQLVKGKRPGFSQDNKYIFYSMDRNTLIVRELSTGYEWKYTGSHFYPQFSPDGRYVALQIQSKKMMAKGRDLIVWEYRSGKKQTIFQDINIDSSGQFIWIK